MTTATTFSRQNDAGSRACPTYYRENLVLVVAVVLESKGLYCFFRRHVCLSNLKHAPSRELPLTARKTVFSHLNSGIR